jgi:hypothetical protein
VASVPIVMFVIHSYQNLPERNTPDDRSSNYTIYGAVKRANVRITAHKETRRDHG